MDGSDIFFPCEGILHDAPTLSGNDKHTWHQALWRMVELDQYITAAAPPHVYNHNAFSITAASKMNEWMSGVHSMYGRDKMHRMYKTYKVEGYMRYRTERALRHNQSGIGTKYRQTFRTTAKRPSQPL